MSSGCLKFAGECMYGCISSEETEVRGEGVRGVDESEYDVYASNCRESITVYCWAGEQGIATADARG